MVAGNGIFLKYLASDLASSAVAVKLENEIRMKFI
jgi:hypothetical protein